MKTKKRKAAKAKAKKTKPKVQTVRKAVAVKRATPKPTGRTLDSIVSQEQHAPWEKLGMSRRTYFRRKSAGQL